MKVTVSFDVRLVAAQQLIAIAALLEEEEVMYKRKFLPEAISATREVLAWAASIQTKDIENGFDSLLNREMLHELEAIRRSVNQLISDDQDDLVK